jgi:hypothetical protein
MARYIKRRGLPLAVIDNTLLTRLDSLEVAQFLQLLYEQILIPPEVKREAYKAPHKGKRRLQKLINDMAGFIVVCTEVDELVKNYLQADLDVSLRRCGIDKKPDAPPRRRKITMVGLITTHHRKDTFLSPKLAANVGRINARNKSSASLGEIGLQLSTHQFSTRMKVEATYWTRRSAGIWPTVLRRP